MGTKRGEESVTAGGGAGMALSSPKGFLLTGAGGLL